MWLVEGDSCMVVAKDLVFLFMCNLLLQNLAYSKCPQSVQCGNHFSLEFPFTGIEYPRCGLFAIDGCSSQYPTINLGGGAFRYNILQKKSANKFFIIDKTLHHQLGNRSCFSFSKVYLPDSPLVKFTLSPNLTLFTCDNFTSSESIEEHFRGYDHANCESPTVYYKTPATDDVTAAGEDLPIECSQIKLPRSRQDTGDLFGLLSAEFDLEWNVSEACYKCYRDGGQCLVDNENEFYCKAGNRGLKRIIFSLSISGAGVLLLLLVAYIIWQRKKKSGWRYLLSSNDKNVELFLKNNGNLAPMRYKYSDIKKMTKSFSENLGKGGYGSVYKGKLLDGRLVAVKILNESRGNGEEFMNEVASISRTSHINIVTLLGFCSEGSKRALIFEFMPNGSLEKFLQNTVPSSTEGGLGWQKLFEIALGIARGLEYLHQGCKTRIVHFDIKPHNILLDKDMNPRISDFGLAKMCPNRSSMVSMLVARGTIGYIAPEVFYRNIGEVSHKSDVYSYGMMILEMAGGKKTFNPSDIDRTSEIYFPHYIYKQLEMDAQTDGSIAGLKNEDESQKRKLIIVGLWCIQTDPRHRPSMTKVAEMLDGKLETLQVPPRPYLSSPPRSIPRFSSASESI